MVLSHLYKMQSLEWFQVQLDKTDKLLSQLSSPPTSSFFFIISLTVLVSQQATVHHQERSFSCDLVDRDNLHSADTAWV